MTGRFRASAAGTGSELQGHRADPVRIGVAGCGASVRMFGPAFASLDSVVAAAWMDPDRERAVAAAQRYGGVSVETWEELLSDAGVDALIIASPVWEHLPQAVAALESGIDVLCEKPMARDATECRTIAATAKRTGRVLVVGFMKRFDPAFRLAQEMIESGEIGEVYELTSRWGWPQYFLAGWRDTRRSGGGLFKDHGSHTVDLARWYLGEAASVTAEVRSIYPGREVEDFAHAVYRHTSGAVSIHHHSRVTHRTMEEYYRIEGTKGSLEIVCEGVFSYSIVRPFSVYLHRNTTGIGSARERVFLDTSLSLDEQVGADYRYSRELQYFARCVANRAEPDTCTALDGIAAVEAIDGAYLSAVTGERVSLPLEQPYSVDALLDQIVARPRR